MLSVWAARLPDELLSDFQSVYGLDIWDFIEGRRVDEGYARRLAALASCLPSDSRVFVADNPDLRWSDEAWMLRQVDLDIRSLAFGLGGGKGRRPKPLPTPSEVKHKQDVAARAEQNAADILTVLAGILPSPNETD